MCGLGWGGSRGLAIAAVVLVGCGGGQAGPDGGGGSGGAGRPSSVTVGGVAWEYQHGEMTGPNAFVLGGVQTVTAVLRNHRFDTCGGGMGAEVPAMPKFINFALPPVVGHFDLPASALTIGESGITLDTSDPGTIDITHVDHRTIEGTIDVPLALSGSAVRGTFVVDACGWGGQDFITGVVCPLPPSASVGGSVPQLSSVSPGGRVVLATSTKAVTVYAPTETAGACSYAPDPAYGVGGVVTFETHFVRAWWDDAERLYVIAEIDVGVPMQQPASLYRQAAGRALESCRFAAMVNGRAMDNTPLYAFVLGDGGAAFLYWSNLGEWSVDLRDPDFGKGDGVCKLVMGADTAAHASLALSGFGDRSMFLETIGGVRRAVEKDAAGVARLTFGGTPSGRGEEGMGDVKLLSRCLTGYCAANDYQLKVFAADGSVRQIVQPFPGPVGVPAPFVLPDGVLSMSALFLGPGAGGTAWLRATYAIPRPTTPEYRDVTVHLKPRP